jgi:hypothetical protein
MEQSNAFRTDNLMAFADSSNYAKEGEGIPEMLQRKAKEQRELEEKKKQISKKILEGGL